VTDRSFEFDPEKNSVNLRKHYVNFATASRIWESYVFERDDERKDYGEQRIIALGAVDGRTLVVVFTWRGSRRRLISARKANKDERQLYQEALAHAGATPEG
jgi:uncharacterized protein